MNRLTERPAEGSEEDIAAQKLERFLALDQVAIRYMNEGEYRFILENGIQGGFETRLVDTKRFHEHILKGNQTTKDWISWSNGDTNWGDILNTDLTFADRMMSLVKEARKNAHDGIGSSRERFLQQFHNVLEPYKQWLNPALRITIMPHSGKEIKEFAKNPMEPNENKLRNLVNHGSRKVSMKRDEQNAPYHLMAVFAPEAVRMNSSSWGREDWKYIQKDAKPENLIAAFSMLPQKDLYQDMIGLSSRAGELAHPIFDSQGNLRWPKNA